MSDLKERDGFVALEVILFGSVLLLIFISIIGFFTYIYPTFYLQRDMDALVRIAQMNGGLTNSDVSEFVERIEKYKFVDTSGESISIEGTTNPSKYNIIGVNAYNYIQRGSGEIMELTVKIPHTNKMINVFGGNKRLKDYYVLTASTLSEKP